MPLKVFVAGGAGVIGRRLIPELVGREHRVTATTRSAGRAAEIEKLGAAAAVVDVFDAPALLRALEAARPDVVIHQLTDLSLVHDAAHGAEALARNAHIRTEGTRNLVTAAVAARVRRMVAQSIVWVYAPGREPHVEDDSLDLAARGNRAVTVGGVVALESAVLGAAPMEGLVLRYGWFYGPGASEKPAGTPGLHVDAAARAAVLAAERGAPGIYNVCEPGPTVSIDKARRELGWDPNYRAA